MGIDTIIVYLIAAGIILAALFIFLNYLNSLRAEDEKASGTLKGIIKTSTGKDLKDIKITLARVRSDEKFSYKAVKDSKGNFFIEYTDNKGFFNMNDVPVGTFWIVVEKKGYKVMLRMVKIKQDSITEVFDVKLK